MSVVRVLGLVLLVAGLLAVAYGGFTYTEETHDVDLGVVELEVKDKERVNIPLWAGLAVVAIGGGLLISDKGRRGIPR